MARPNPAQGKPGPSAALGNVRHKKKPALKGRPTRRHCAAIALLADPIHPGHEPFQPLHGAGKTEGPVKNCWQGLGPAEMIRHGVDQAFRRFESG